MTPHFAKELEGRYVVFGANQHFETVRSLSSKSMKLHFFIWDVVIKETVDSENLLFFYCLEVHVATKKRKYSIVCISQTSCISKHFILCLKMQ